MSSKLVTFSATVAFFAVGTLAFGDEFQFPSSVRADRISEVENRLDQLESRIQRLPDTVQTRFEDGKHAASSGDFDESDCDCGGGCNSSGCGECGTCFVWSENTWLKIGGGIRTSYNTVEDGAPNGSSWSNNFNVDNLRIYLSGQGHEYIKFEFNTDINNAQGFQNPIYPIPGSYDEAGNIRVLDAIAKFEFNDLFNVWVGRMLPPSDRSNLDGPFFLNAWDFPFVQFGYPNIFQGRDDGAAFWGQLGGGVFKYQVGVFEGVNGAIAGSAETLPILGANPGDDMMFTARATLNLLDPEPGYYNQSTYYGEKDILAVGFAVMDQNNANVDGASITDYTGWSLDGLYEQVLGNSGVMTVEGAYYDFDDHGATNSFRDGQSYFVLVSYLCPDEICIGPISGRLQPFSRYQSYDRTNFIAGSLVRQTDVGVNYIMHGHNARVAAFWAEQDFEGGMERDLFRIGVQLQF